MKDISGAILASLFVLFSLFSLVVADSRPGGTSLVVNTQGTVSEIALRYALEK
ncbi:MAG: hypothetical protein ACREQ7_11970 [Candidatus Binatia bacterium]